ncbi:MAG: hypothetical protein GYB36_12865 [Alphaproteobacteria bacterium]|nr:hypothetical protein [Alphaproteobacteria bacterium]
MLRLRCNVPIGAYESSEGKRNSMKFQESRNPHIAGMGSGFLNSSSTEALMAAKVADLAGSKSDIEAQIAALPEAVSDHEAEGLLKTAVVVSIFLEQSLPRHKRRLANLEKVREAQAKELRDLQWRAGMDRLPRCPNVLKTLLLVQVFVLAETLLMAAMLIEGGHIGVVEGIGFGFVFSAVNSVLALWTGFSFVRMAAHRKASPVPKSSDGFVRIMGKLGIAAFGGLLGILIFAASRIRATGSHVPFDFSEVGLWEGLNNGVSLAILATALMASAVNLWKGATGFSDFVIGASEALVNATDKITFASRNATGQAIRSVLGRVGAFLSDTHKFLKQSARAEKARSRQVHAINGKIRAHNAALGVAKQSVLAAHANQEDHREKVLNRRRTGHSIPDVGELDKLALPLIGEAIAGDDREQSKLEELKAVANDIAAARDALIADLETAQAEFEAASIGVTPFPEDNKEGA